MRVVARLTFCDAEESILKSSYRRARFARPDFQSVNGNDWSDLPGSAAEESLLRGREFTSVDVAFLNLDAGLAKQLEHGRTRDALEYVARSMRRAGHTIAYHEKAHPRPFGHFAADIEHECRVVAVGLRLQACQTAVLIVRIALYPHGHGIVGHALPRADLSGATLFQQPGPSACRRGDGEPHRSTHGRSAEAIDKNRRH